jgi:hypothetical protein
VANPPTVMLRPDDKYWLSIDTPLAVKRTIETSRAVSLRSLRLGIEAWPQEQDNANPSSGMDW